MPISPFIALFGAGLLTFASPCVLPLLPMYLAVLGGSQAVGMEMKHEERTRTRRLRLAGVGFALGLGLVFVALGMGASALSASITEHRRALALGAGALMVLLGAKMLGLVRLPWLDREARPLLSRVPSVGGFGGGLLFGAAFAIGWTPCVGPVLGAALTYAALTTSNPLLAGAMLASYALGLAAPLLAASFAASHLLVLTTKLRKFTPTIHRTAGVLMLGVGALLASDKLSTLTPSLSIAAGCGPEAKACEAGPSSPNSNSANLEQLPKGPALVEFISGHCTVCQKMHPIVAELERTCAPGLISRINIDDTTGRAIATHYGVTLVPTFISIDDSGSAVQRSVGAQTKEQLKLALAEISGAPCSETKLN